MKRTMTYLDALENMKTNLKEFEKLGLKNTTATLPIQKVIEALEKQVPKKPRFVDVRFRNHGRKISDGSSLCECYECPSCRLHIFHVFEDENYCKYCGQALEWDINS